MHDRSTVILAWLAFTVVMLVIGWVLKLVVPPAHDWAVASIGRTGAWAVFLAVILACAVFGYWPRDAAGRMRRLPTLR
ncbi:hypothetical protein ASG40_13020 [Methylobacterium sp. Leaf399]|uniref:hypothetical protein n=1 Tax=unclassified Methylobacterium TaxID=2615210 RepID=UPI0006F67A77|nr:MULTISPECIES: hypothetical protein [unclassified Methylobacterium]KQP50842.1 hypothetical protein ASF39_11400 [Methylobacterium sp. Leaf108]KQT07823.1 hypothetical protein ASG40_13020 [Methylobacterium sp. Leaf399]KQT88938.1 hypothetical protein ASG59_13790 [Methylobacterium sp. Leaf466]